MEYLQDIILDLNPNAASPIVSVKQGDTGRILKIFITKDDEPLYITAD